MKIKAKDVTERGLKVAKSLEPEEIGLSEEELECVLPLEVDASLERAGKTILANVDVKTRLAFSCSRCLENVERDIQENFKFDYPFENELEVIDLGEDIRQEMIVVLPQRVLCRDDCKGICLHCGANLNEEECSCGK